MSVLNKSLVRKWVSSWLTTQPSFKYFGLAPNESVFSIKMCGSGTVSGLPFMKALFEEFGCCVNLEVSEGELLTSGAKIATVSGSTDDIMFCERLALIVLSRASGITSFTKRLQKLLCESSWQGEFCIPPSLTPGFELVEEYAMLLGGAASKSSLVVRRCHVDLLGVDQVIQNIRSRVKRSSKIAVECVDADEANAAAKAGADVLVLSVISVKELDFLTNIEVGNQVEIEINACFDEADVKSYALSNINYLTTSRLTNGYPAIEFQLVKEANNETVIPGQKRNSSCLDPTPTNAVPVTDRKTDTQKNISDTLVEVASPTASDPKKARIKDVVKKAPNLPKESKPNGSPSRRSGPSYQSSVKDQSAKRPQKNLHAPYNAMNRMNSPRNQSPGGLQTNQQRFNSPLFGQNQQSQPVSKPLFSAMNSQSPGFRQLLPLPQQRSGQQLNPNLLTAAAFMNMQQQSTAQQSLVSQPPSCWSSIAGAGTGAMMSGGGMGQGMRFGSNLPLHCRICGSTYGPGMSFCRTCRNPL